MGHAARPESKAQLGSGTSVPYRALLGFRRDFPKIHDSFDVVRVANKMKPCDMKNLSSTNL